MSGAPQISGLVYVQPLGSGGNADVYLYEQQSPRMPVAVKVLRRPAGREGDPVSRRAVAEFLDEADTMAALGDHPYIVQVFRAGTAPDGRPYLVMKYYPPPNLAQRSRSERFPVAEVLRTGIQLASAVETAHQARIVHRDIKPANVLISSYGAPGLTDFGIAGRGLGEDRGAGGFTGREETGVSVPWAAPEVVFGESDGDERADVYSLGATLWQLLTGRSPFEVPGGDNTAFALMPRIRSQPVPPTGRTDVPASLERLLAQAMAKDPAHRPASALEFARGLQTIEQQLHLARTQILVLDERGRATLLQHLADAAQRPAPDVAPVVAATEYTHVQGVARIDAQGPAARPGQPRVTPTAPTVATVSTTAPSVAPPALPPAGVRMPLAPTETGAAQPALSGAQRPPDAPARGAAGRDQRMFAMVLAGVAALVVVGVAGWFVVARSSGTGPTPAPRPSTIAPTTDTSAIGDGVFVPPTLTAQGVGGAVRFAWTYDTPGARDTFRLQIGATEAAALVAAPMIVSTPVHEVTAAAAARVCALVAVVRAGQISPASTVQCATAG